MAFIDGQSRYVTGKYEGGAGGLGSQVAYAEYDFAVDGGAIGTIPLMPAADIPTGAIIVRGVLEILTALTSGGAATAAIQVEAANDTVNAAAVSGAPWSTTGRKNVIPVDAATSLKTTAARNVSLVIATATLTAGKFNLWLYYLPTV